MARDPDASTSYSLRMARQFGIVVDRCYARWPRNNPDYFNELLGDLMELSLARGYSDDDLMHIVKDISSLSEAVTSVYSMLKRENPLHNRPFNVHIDPKVIADILLSAHTCHRMGEWSIFNQMLESPELVM